MAKKFFTKALSVGLSLTLCAGLVAPALAASFTDLQDAIDGDSGKDLGNGYTGYGASDVVTEENKGYDIWAKGGSDNREVVLHGDVEREDGEGSIVIKNGKDVNLDLNGHDIDANPDAVLNVEDGKFYEAEKDEDGNKIATENVATDLNSGSVIRVEGGATLTLDDSAATGTAGSEDAPYTSGKITGGINMGGGVMVREQGKLVMNGGAISGNYSGWRGGGVYIDNDSRTFGTFEMNDGVISDNYVAADGGAGVYSSSSSGSGNDFAGGKFIMRGGAIEGNRANGSGGGIQANGASETKLIGGTIKNNTASYGGDDIYFYGGKSENSSGSRWLVDSNIDKNVMQEYVIPEDGVIPERIGLRAAELDAAGNIIVPVGKTVIDKDGKAWGEDELPFGGKIDKDGKVVPNPDPNAVPDRTPTPVTRIGDQAIPLADGPVTRAQFIDYLWRHEGEPEAEVVLFADHEYAPAIAWALSAELIDEEFQPDELVTVADVRAILGSFEAVFGAQAVAAADLASLTGADDEAVLNCGEVLAEFFGEEYAPAQAEDELAA